MPTEGDTHRDLQEESDAEQTALSQQPDAGEQVEDTGRTPNLRLVKMTHNYLLELGQQDAREGSLRREKLC